MDLEQEPDCGGQSQATSACGLRGSMRLSKRPASVAMREGGRPLGMQGSHLGLAAGA